jgi:hypothetical protein
MGADTRPEFGSSGFINHSPPFELLDRYGRLAGADPLINLNLRCVSLRAERASPGSWAVAELQPSNQLQELQVEMAFWERVAGAAFQILLEPLDEFQGVKRSIELKFPRHVFCRVRAFASVVFCEAPFEIGCMPAIE